MPTPLMRESLQALYKAAHGASPHTGLLLQHGWAEDVEDEAKTNYVRRVCNVTVDNFYRHAFRRWTEATADEQRFRQLTLDLKSRLFIGTAGGGALETACAIGHSHGMPYIPGSSVKGVVNAHARQRFAGKGEKGRAIRDELFGSGPNGQHSHGLAGLIGFHDAWWVPESAESPLVPEVVTTHHKDYYGSEGKSPATDFDSPIPNAQVAVQGSFLFVMEGPSAWLGLAAEILTDALHTRGIGAKTRAGYGYFDPTPPSAPAAATCQWVDETIAELVQENNNAPADDILRGRQLAARWASIEDTDLKQEALADIRGRWEERDWWEEPPGKASRAAKEIYIT